MALIWSQKVDTIEMLLRPYSPSLENFRALAGPKGKLGQTWSKIVQNGPKMAPVIQHSVGLSWVLVKF